MYNIGDIVVRDFSSFMMGLSTYNFIGSANDTARIISNVNINKCYKVEIIKSNHLSVGFQTWWSTNLMSLLIQKEPDWEI